MSVLWSDDSVFLPKTRADIDPATWQVPGLLDINTNFKSTVQDLVDSASPYVLRLTAPLDGTLRQVSDNAAAPTNSRLFLSSNYSCFSSGVMFGAYGNPTATVETSGAGATNATINGLFRNSGGANLMKIYDGLKVEFCNALVTIDQAGSFKFDMNGSSARYGSIFSNAYSAASAAQGYLAFKDYNTGEDIMRNYDGATAARALRISDTNNFAGFGSSIFSLDSTTKGFKMPSMTTAQKNAIATPVAGMQVFDTTLSKICVYSGAAWETVTSV